jgi:hypothetical protein
VMGIIDFDQALKLVERQLLGFCFFWTSKHWRVRRFRQQTGKSTNEHVDFLVAAVDVTSMAITVVINTPNYGKPRYVGIWGPSLCWNRSTTRLWFAAVPADSAEAQVGQRRGQGLWGFSSATAVFVPGATGVHFPWIFSLTKDDDLTDFVSFGEGCLNAKDHDFHGDFLGNMMTWYWKTIQRQASAAKPRGFKTNHMWCSLSSISIWTGKVMMRPWKCGFQCLSH